VTAVAVSIALALAPRAAALPSSVPDQSWATNGRVSAIVQVGNIIYVGGNFTEVHENGGEGPGVLARKNLAAFDATTGAPTAWAPSANGEVLALAASPDAKRIYAGGKFTSVNSSARGRVAAIKTTTGLVDTTWRPPSFSANVNALAATGDRLYVGGAFLKAGLESRSRLAALSTTTAALEPGWVPVADGLVRTLSLAPDGARGRACTRAETSRRCRCRHAATRSLSARSPATSSPTGGPTPASPYLASSPTTPASTGPSAGARTS